MVIIKCGKCGQVSEAKELHAYARYQCNKCNAVNEVSNIPIKEWIGYDYQQFLSSIKKFINQDKYEDLQAKNEIEAQAGKLMEQLS